MGRAIALTDIPLTSSQFAKCIHLDVLDESGSKRVESVKFSPSQSDPLKQIHIWLHSSMDYLFDEPSIPPMFGKPKASYVIRARVKYKGRGKPFNKAPDVHDVEKSIE